MIRTLAALFLTAAIATGCGDGVRDDQATGSIRAEDVQTARAQMDPEVRTRIDAGNEAYREGRYDEARQQYQTATQMAPNEAAGWFGIYMVESAEGNQPAAEEAIRRAREAAPRASLIEEGDTL